jgi:SAM-dependent methyltransferase
MLTVDYERLGLSEGDLVLDLGCGFGRHVYESLRCGARVVACDLALPELHQVLATSAAMVEVGDVSAQAQTSAVIGDAQRLPFPNEVFDQVIASEVLEHVPDDSVAMSELTRVLKPGGVLAVTVPSYVPERICWAISDDYHAPAAEGGHVRIYSRRDLDAQINRAGLIPIDRHRAHALHSPYWWLKCAVGVDNDENPFVRQYLRFLTWDIVEAPKITRFAEKILSPILGKSTVVYAQKPVTRATEGSTASSRPAEVGP